MSKQLPSCIHGDLDSLRPDVRQFYQQKGVSITQDDDQYSTDFCKAMKMIDRSRLQSTNDDEKSDWNQINILGSIAGRVDQGIGLLHEMLREQVTRPQLDFILFSDRSISYILHRGLNRIELDVSAGIVTPNVGILPIYGPATISTQGLEWDVQGWRTEMGGNMSTSNHVVRNVVEVDTDAKILFTIERAETLPRWSV
ncbi:MAG: hypothetical protein M1821_005397 [Bathelium mastoideum]|nr:MAG: hypothetical protein M1821_005397 [Bathelium mastoideum]KAI9688055.1 MAG: hypothetical protein M1822_001560 [Bathelium mastoideum]